MSGIGLRHAMLFSPLIVFWFAVFPARAENGAAQFQRPPLRVRGDFVYPPYEFLHDGRADGFNVELIRAVGEVMGLEMEISLGPWSEVRSQLERGEIDVITGMFHSPERERYISFSVPHSMVFYDIFVRADSPIRSLDDLRDKRVLVQRGDIMHDYLLKTRITPHIQAMDDIEGILRLLSSGSHDCAIIAKLSGLYYIDIYRLTNLRGRDIDFPPQKYCFAVSSGDTLLLARLNQGLDILKKSGRYREIHEKWFGVYERQSFIAASRPFLIALGVAVALLTLSAAWMLSLRRQVRLRTADFRESEERFRFLIEHAPDAIYIQIGTTFAYVNPTAARLFGAATPESLAGTAVLDRIAPESRDMVLKRTRTLEENRVPLPVVEYQYLRPDGSRLDAEVSSVPIVWKGENGALVFARDITERKAAADALRESERRYRLLAENARDIIYRLRLRPSVRVEYLSPSVLRVTGYAAEEFYADPGLLPRIVSRGDGRTLRGLLRRESYSEPHIIRWTARNGRLVWTEQRMSPVFDEFGRIVAVEGIARDITERRRMEEELARSEAQYRELVESAGSIILRLDRSGIITFLNEYGCRFFGHASSELTGKNIFDTIFLRTDSEGRDQTGMIEDFPFNPVRYLSYENESVKKSGERAWISWNNRAIRNDMGTVIEILCIGQDATARRRAEEAIMESEYRFRTLFDTISSGVAVYEVRGDGNRGCDYVVRDFNRAALDIEHLTKGEVIGRTLADLRPAIDDYGLIPVFRRVRETGRAEHFPVTLYQDTQITGWYENRVFRLPSGEIVAVYDDLTEQMNAREAIRERDERYREVFENTSDGFFLIDVTREGRFRFNQFNPAAERMLGLTNEQVSGKLVEEALSPHAAPLILSQYRTCVAAGDPISYEEDMARSHERRVYFTTLIPVRNEAGEIRRLVGVSRDITHRRQAEEELRNALGALRAIIDASPLAIFDLDTGSRIRSIWNAAAERIFGWSREEVIGQFLLTVPPEHLEEHFALRTRVLRDESFTSVEVRRRRKDGTIIDVTLATAPLYGEDGRVNGIMVICDDITERKRLERQFLQAQKMETVGRLAGGIAHDFNNLLTAIIGNAELALLSAPSGSELAGDLAEIRRTADRAAALTRQLLAFSRRQIIEPKTLNLNDVLTGLDKMLRRLIGENIELTTLPETGLRSVTADPGQIEQVLTNLVVNARDAMPNGGRLSIETRNVALDEEYVRDHPDTEPGEYVMMAVTDTGVGMSAEVLAHLFEPFFTTKESGKGTGLGLSTCYGIVKQNRGSIWVYSEPGMGTSVKVFLPAAEGEIASVPVSRTEPLSRGTETVLVAEDDPAVKTMIARILSDNGYQVLEAADGRQAITIAETSSEGIHLLLTDVVMPRMGGKALADELMRRHPHLRVLFMSGYTDDSIVRQEVLEHGVSFIQKPFPPAVLLRKVREILEGGGHA